MKIFLLFSILTSTFCFAISQEELFLKAFGSKPPEIFYPMRGSLRIDGVTYPVFQFMYDPYHRALKLPINVLIARLPEHIQLDGLDTLKQIQSTGMITDKTLEELGYQLRFDQRKEVLSIKTPARIRKTVVVSLKNKKIQRKDYSSTSAFFSHYTNIYGTYTLSNSINSDNNRRLSFENVSNIHGIFSVESEFNYNDQDTTPFLLDGVRVVFDSPTTFTSTYIGDLQTHIVNQSLMTDHLVGVGKVKSFDMYNTMNPSPEYASSILLEQPQYILIEVNDKVVDELFLDEGRYTLTDFPLDQGKNNLRLTFFDQERHKLETAEHTYYFDSSLLKKGVNEYSLFTGVPVDYKTSSVTDELHSGFFLSKGYTDSLTLSQGIMYGEDHLMYSSTLLKSSSLGLIRSQYNTVLYSQQYYRQTFILNVLGYEQKKSYGRMRHDVYFSFMTPATVIVNNDSITDRYFNVRQQWYIYGRRKKYAIRVSAGYYPKPSVGDATFRLSSYSMYQQGGFEKNIELTKEVDHSVTFSLFLRLILSNFQRKHQMQTGIADDSQYVSYAYQSQNFSKNSSTYYAAEVLDADRFKVDSQIRRRLLRSNISYFQQSGEYHLSGGTRLNGSRGYISHDIESQDIGSKQDISFDTSIAFVDGHMGIGRRIYENFVLVTAPKSLKFNYIELNSRSRIDWLGSAVVSNLPSYQPKTISIFDLDLEEGQVLADRSFSVTPKKRQGMLLSVAPEGNYMITARLQTHTEKPISYAFGEIRSDKETATPIPFFTNQEGKIFVTGLSEGTFTVIFYDTRFKSFPITVKSNKTTIINFGTITVDEDTF